MQTRMPGNMICISQMALLESILFFSKNAGELCFIPLRRKMEIIQNSHLTGAKYRHTDTHS
jgi:hypothetical protein